MLRLHNVLIVLVSSLVLIGPALVWTCELVGVELPSWTTAEDAKWLSGGVSEADVRGNLNPEGFSTGTFQDAVMTEVGNRIPFKADAMLGNAALQRSMISLANTPFSYPCYPTYYGSMRLCLPEFSAVTYLPHKRQESQIDGIYSLGRGVADSASRHPEARFSVVLVQTYREPSTSPAYDLISDPARPEEYADALEEGLSNQANARLFTETYQDLDSYYHDFFLTDHHWNWRGVSRAYNSIAEGLDLACFESPGEVAIGDYSFTGATARWGLDPLAEQVSDTSYTFPGVMVDGLDGVRVPFNHDAFFARDDPGKRYVFYDSYHSAPDVLYGPGKGHALVIANSLGSGIAPYIAQNYEETHLLGHIHPKGRDVSLRLDTLMAEYSASDVYIVGDAGDLSTFMSACPDYFAAA